MTKQQTVVILGAGFGGIRCALDLYDRLGNRPDIKIVLIDKQPAQSFHAALYEVAAAHCPREAIALPIKKAIGRRSIRFVQAIVEQLDPTTQQVYLHHHEPIRYDYLVIALGCVPNDYHIPGLADYGHFFSHTGNALQVRRHVEAAVRTKKEVKIVIGGGGPTGTELAAAFKYYARDFCHNRGSHHEKLSVDLIELSGRVLSGLPNRMAKLTDRYLRKLGVRPYYHVGIAKVTSKTITLTDSRQIPYDVLIWTGGIKPNPAVRHDAFIYDNRGRIVVTKYLQAKGFSRIYAIGDIASFATGKKATLPQVAPQAIAEGEHVARNIARQIHEQHPVNFQPTDHLTIIPLGGNYGVLRWGKLVFQGSWTLWVKQFKEWQYFSGVVPLSVAWGMAIKGRHHWRGE